MKLNISKSVVFILFAMQYQLSTAQQTESLPDSYYSRSSHEVVDIQNRNANYIVPIQYEGECVGDTQIKRELSPAKEGDNAENPVDFGTITQPYHGMVAYDTREFNDCYAGSYSSGPKDVYLKFDFPQDVEFSLSPDDAKVGGAFVSLLDSNQRQIQLITTNAYPNTSLYKSRLAAGTYYIVLEGAGMDGELGADIRILPLNNLADSQWAPTPNMNYVVTMTPTYETSNSGNVSPKQSNTSIKYYDRLGRPLQVKQYAASPNGNDIVVQQEYNVFGLQYKSYLPVDEGNKGIYSPINNILSRAGAIYNDTKPYQLTKYDTTPLMRVTEQYGPGQIWQDTGRSIKSHSDLNTDSIIRFAVAELRTDPELIRTKGYATKSLSVVSLTDEDGHSVHKFTDINGRNILTRVENGSELLDTYSVYDDYGNLCFVLPPMADASNASAAELDKYAYAYRYDYRNRCVGKKLPGAEWAYSIYDYADNLVFSQDGESQSRGEWNCTLCDKFRRPVISGVYKGTVDRETINKQVVVAKFDNTGSYGYSFNVLNPDSLDVLTVTYYDNYDFKRILPNYSAKLDYAGDNEYDNWYNHYAYNSKGLVTGSVTAVLDEDKRIYAATYYDDRKRPVQVRTTTPQGGLSVDKFRYDFVGNVVKSCETQQPTADASPDVIVRENEYDKTGRKVSVQTSLNNGPAAIVEYEYDPIGRLVATTQGTGPEAIRTEKKYNIRGWLTEQNSDLFSMELNYTNPQFATPSYTGNIMEWSWRYGADSDENTYVFSYDDLARLTDTQQYVNGQPDDLNVERGMSYDLNGNILSLQRYADGVITNNYSYTYSGNQLSTLSSGTSAAPMMASAGSRRLTPPIGDFSLIIEWPLNPVDPPGPTLPPGEGPINPGWPINPDWPIIPIIPIDPDRPIYPEDPDMPIHTIDPGILFPPLDPGKPTDPIVPPADDNDGPSDEDILPPISPDTIYSGNKFRYDYNGNMVYDALRNRNIRYNRLNLLKKVVDNQTTSANYRYLSDGTKLSVLDSLGNGLEYLGSLVYQRQNGVLTLESAAVEGGRIRAGQSSSGATYALQYYLADHLGSTRAITDGTAANTIRYDYYPFGKQCTAADSQISDNRNLFNGKEWQPTGGVNLLDYGARMYDSELGIWGVPDPMNTMYPQNSPYLYCYGNPLRFIDPSGQFPYKFDWLAGHYYDQAGNVVSYGEVEDYVKTSIRDVRNRAYDFANAVYTPYLDAMATSSNMALSITGLMGEFMTGFGAETREFGEDAPLTQSIKGSNMTKIALKKFYEDYINGNTSIDPKSVSFQPFGSGDTGPGREFSANGMTAIQFVGTATYYFNIENGVVKVKVYDTKTPNSLFYHITPDRHSRESFPIMGETKQTYIFSIPLSQISNYINQ